MDKKMEHTARKIKLQIFATLMVFCLFLVACGPVPTGTTELPAATEAPAGTEVPAAVEATATLPVTNCETLFPSDDCDPDWQGRIEYVPLAGLPTVDCTETLLDGGQCDARLYTNSGQQFIIRIEGADPAVINDYINNTKMYFEVHQAGLLPPIIPQLPSLGKILVETAITLTKSSLEDLMAKLEEMLKEREGTGEGVTFADVLIAITGDNTVPDQVLEAAISQASSEYVAIGEDASLIPEEMNALMYEPGASVLLSPTSLPEDNSGYQELLMNNPSSLAVIFDWTTVPKEQVEDLWTIWYAVDPPIAANESSNSNFQTSVGSNASVYYKAKCGVYSAYTKLTATAGSMTNSFWRQSPWLSLPTRIANISSTAAPPTVSHSSYPAKVTYDTQVRGGSGGGQYYLYGGWVQGSFCQ